MSDRPCPHATNSTAAARRPLMPSSSTATAASSATGAMPTPSGTPFDIDRVFATGRYPFEPASLRPAGEFVLGTRKSNLALTQTQLVADALAALHPSSSGGLAALHPTSSDGLAALHPSSFDGGDGSDLSASVDGRAVDGRGTRAASLTFTVESMTTVGDKNQTTPLHLLTPYSQQQPAKSLWTDELEARLTSGHYDMLVHSLKDVPTTLKAGCEIGAILEREDPRDCLVMRDGRGEAALEELPQGSVIGTGSIRRVAQLKRAFPGLKFEDMRGNLNTRLAKLDHPTSPFAALILATSGLARLGMSHRITAPISSPTLYHAVGQGALGVEIRSGDARVRAALRGVGHWPTEWRCAAERGCLRVLEGGCSVPVGVETELEELDPSTEPDVLWAMHDFDPITPDSPMLHFSGILDRSAPLPLPYFSTPTESASATEPESGSASASASVPAPAIGTTSALVPGLRARRARLTLRVCVTSLDGSDQVVRCPAPVVVADYQQAERFGELVAREVKEMGGKAILDQVAQVRRDRERRDLERAIDKSRQEAERLAAATSSAGAAGVGSSSDPGGAGGAAGVIAQSGEEEGMGGEGAAEGPVHQGLQELVKILTSSPTAPSRRQLDG